MTETTPRTSRATKYPVLVVGVALLGFLATVVLPSSLKYPQGNPTETPEYAPVGEGDSNASQGGILSSFGLSGGGRTGGLTQEFASAPGSGFVVGKTLGTRKCVGTPPRQTEDRMSPPCVASFQGDNFGSTYQGVSRDEIRVLFNRGDDSSDSYPAGSYVDLAKPPSGTEGNFMADLRVWQQYFNSRFQTYGRVVHFFVYFRRSGNTPEKVRADAIDNWVKIKPFAANTTLTSYQDDYMDALKDKGVMVIVGQTRLPSSFYQRHPGLAWGYGPSADYFIEHVTGYLCTKVMPHPVSFSGNPADTGPRKLGLLHTSDTNDPSVTYLWKGVKKGVEACGGVWVDEQTYPGEGLIGEDTENTDPNQSRSRANAEAMASFRLSGVTTVIWTGVDLGNTPAAAAIQYRPEWIQILVWPNEGNLYGRVQEPSEWEHAWLLTEIVRESRLQDTSCYQAYAEVDPSAADKPADAGGLTPIGAACERGGYYHLIRQLFTGIQVAGPRLTPESMNKGFRAIPAKASTDPFIPACYYLPGDYTCVKDLVAEWWDPSAPVGYSSITGTPVSGCWRMPQEGRRYIRNGWPPGDVTATKDPSADPCNNLEV